MKQKLSFRLAKFSLKFKFELKIAFVPWHLVVCFYVNSSFSENSADPDLRQLISLLFFIGGDV